jgi:hypothetical protein
MCATLISTLSVSHPQHLTSPPHRRSLCRPDGDTPQHSLTPLPSSGAKDVSHNTVPTTTTSVPMRVDPFPSPHLAPIFILPLPPFPYLPPLTSLHPAPEPSRPFTCVCPFNPAYMSSPPSFVSSPAHPHSTCVSRPSPCAAGDEPGPVATTREGALTAWIPERMPHTTPPHCGGIFFQCLSYPPHTARHPFSPPQHEPGSFVRPLPGLPPVPWRSTAGGLFVESSARSFL